MFCIFLLGKAGIKTTIEWTSKWESGEIIGLANFICGNCEWQNKAKRKHQILSCCDITFIRVYLVCEHRQTIYSFLRFSISLASSNAHLHVQRQKKKLIMKSAKYSTMDGEKVNSKETKEKGELKWKTTKLRPLLFRSSFTVARIDDSSMNITFARDLLLPLRTKTNEKCMYKIWKRKKISTKGKIHR